MRRTLLTCLALFIVSQVLFLINIQYPHGYSFDEVFYVPAGRAFAQWTGNTNRFHPPLGKYLIALGIRMWGDTPFGWRLMSSIFGGITVAGMYCWALAVFRKHSIALWTSLITLCNQFLYILARTAMLDVFMFAFMVWGMAAFSAAWTRDISPHRARRLLMFAGVMFGLTTACKWLGVVPWFLTIALILFTPLVRSLRSSEAEPPAPTNGRMSDEPWFGPDLMHRAGLANVFVALIIVPVVVYCLTLIPLLWLPGPDASLHGLWEHHLAIWHEHTTAGGSPVQSSMWYQWPLNSRPLFFWFEHEGNDWVRAVLLLGNPVVLWTGFAALAFCLWSWLKRASREAFLVLVWYGALYMSWAVIPRRIFYYYYYYPAAMTLSLALAFVVHHNRERKLLGVPAHWVFMAVAAAMFAIRLPVSSAMRVPLDWMVW